MVTIVMESILFVALMATSIALLFFVVMNYTVLGVRFRQTQNRKRLERAAELVCPVHGPHAEHDMVRLTSGGRLCPDCYQEAIDGKLD